jgi:hypothetical protein
MVDSDRDIAGRCRPDRKNVAQATSGHGKANALDRAAKALTDQPQ